MNAPQGSHPRRGIYVRLFVATVALAAGAAALVVAIQLVRSVLS